MAARTVLFVYGTLKRGERANRLLAGQTYLGPATTAPRYRLVDLGDHPGMIPDAAAGLSVTGELWEVSECCLDELDDYEGCPVDYVRGIVDVIGATGPVEGYRYVGPVPIGARTGGRWPFPACQSGAGAGGTES